jgi:hypothetical protein
MAITERYVTSTGTDTYANSTNSATPMSLSTAFTNAVAGDRINIKVGTYTRAASDQPTNAGTATSPIIFRGYSSTIGDGYLGFTNSALVTTNMPTIAYNATFRVTAMGAFTIWETIKVTGNVSNSLMTGTGANDAMIKSCSVTNASTNAAAAALSVGGRMIAFDNDLILSGASGGSAAVTNGAIANKVLYNRIKGGPAVGLLLNANQAYTVIGNVIYSSTGVGISITNVTQSSCILGNTIVGGGADAINIVTATTGLQCIMNNLITDNTGDGIDMVSTGNAAGVAYNRTRDNANAYNNAGDWITATKWGDVTTDTGGAETDYVASASNDYRLISASPARGAGLLPSASIGALQFLEPTPSLRIPSFPTI